MKPIHPYRRAYFTNGIPYHKYFLRQSGNKYDFRKDYNDITNSNDIFIGDRKNCLIISINCKSKTLVANIQDFQSHDSENKTLMNSAIKRIKKVTISDNIDLLYFFKYGESYYQKNFGFWYIKKINRMHQAENMRIRENHFINKKEVRKELLQYFSKEKLDRFLEFIKNGESIVEFVKNFTCPEKLFDIYYAFLKYEYKDKKYNNLFGEVLCKLVKRI